VDKAHILGYIRCPDSIIDIAGRANDIPGKAARKNGATHEKNTQVFR
jgi:hypothetical protein